ncbi:hypothetical protein ES703_82428 [subsurface metagenome]
MKYLLDTHVFLWMIAHPENLSKKAKDLLEAEETLLFLSTVSGLEIAIKYQLGRLRLPDDPIRYIPELPIQVMLLYNDRAFMDENTYCH